MKQAAPTDMNRVTAAGVNHAPATEMKQATTLTGLLSGAALPGWVILPLRLFLGGSFLLAGLDKLTDPTYLDPASRSYIGQQILGYASGTPLDSFLLNVAEPNAVLFGVLTMGGEICIGIAILLGLLTRFSALMGLLLNLTFFLSATWNVHPFYFGADLPYAMGWLTLVLAGPGPLALDTWVRHWLNEGRPAPVAARHPGTRPPVPTPADDSAVMTRRVFLGASVAGLAGIILAGSGLGWGLLHPRGAAGATAPGAGTGTTPSAEPPVAVLPPTAAPTAAPPTAAPAPTKAPSDAAPTEAPAPTAAPPTAAPAPTEAPPTAAPAPPTAASSVPAGRTVIAGPGALPAGQALEFTLPDGNPAVLVHNAAGYSAYVAVCTHEGCQVAPLRNGLLACPCHGAQFDPAANGQAVRGPARRPLQAVAVATAPDGSIYINE